MGHKKSIVLILMCFLMVLSTACVKDDKPYQFEGDLALSKFINLKIANQVFDSKLGAVPLQLAFANRDYVGLLNYNGLLIYRLEDKKLSSAIDIKGLGFDRIQGDGALLVSANDDYVVLSKVGEKGGYVYSFSDKSLAKMDDVSKISVNKMAYLDYEALSKVNLKIVKDENKLYDAIKTESGYLVLSISGDTIKEARLIELDKKGEVFTSFRLSE